MIHNLSQTFFSLLKKTDVALVRFNSCNLCLYTGVLPTWA
jgi:hypothetical protein